MNFLLVALAALTAGIVQGVTGFGSGIVLMMVLPFYFSLASSAGVSTAICMSLNILMICRYRKYIDFKKILLPTVEYLVFSYTAIRFSTMINQAVMKKVFGVFLLALSFYYLFIAKNTGGRKMTVAAAILCIAVSGVCDGLFGIGGPLMVLYYMSQTSETKEYLGTIQSFFFLVSVFNTIFRIYNGIIGVEHLPLIGLGIVCILTSGALAAKIVDRLDGNVIKKIIYVVIGVSGLINLLK